MKETLFTKTFFKFATGFMAIIFLGIIGVFLAGVYDSNESVATPPTEQLSE